MRFHSLFLLARNRIFGKFPQNIRLGLTTHYLLLTTLLVACGKADSPVRLDFVGDTNLTSSDRTLNAGDTIRTHVFVQRRTGGAALRHLTITVDYQPGPQPIVYPALLASFTRSMAPDDVKLTMYDADIPNQPAEFIFRPTFGARTTSGTERWQYTATDTDGNTATRAYRLTVRRPDSAAVYQLYTLLPRFGPEPTARVYFALRPGLLLPRFAVENQPDNQNLIDLVAVNTAGTLTLQAPAAAPLLPASWAGTKRATSLRRTSLDGNAFNGVVTDAGIVEAYNGASGTAGTSSGTLAAGNVLAFRTDAADGRVEKYGLISIAAVSQAAVPTLTCVVRMQK